MKNYSTTIGYKAVITVSVKANSEQEAKEKALKYFHDKERQKWYNSKETVLEDDTYAVYGVLDMDNTWYEL